MQNAFERRKISGSSLDFYTPSMELHVKSIASIDTVRLSMCNDLSCSDQYLIPDASTTSTSVTVPESQPETTVEEDKAKAKQLLVRMSTPSPSSSPLKPIIQPVINVAEDRLVKKVDTPPSPPTLTPTSAKFFTFKPYIYPILHIPIKVTVPEIDIRICTNVTFLTDGSNANVYSAEYHGQKVIIKMMKEKCQHNSIAIHEFEMELAILSRIHHPNIVRALAAGRHPRRFIILEALEGGSLNAKLKKNIAKTGYVRGKVLHRPTFSYCELLARAREIADALDYIHTRCYPGASIIHRDLKPDNIGFAKDGTIKIFDFGLSTCVKQRVHATDTYKMTGYTGSLRYMAPEVALRQVYTERVDVYSFGLLLWQMARDRVPFQPYNKDEIMQLVVVGQMRPKMSSIWPKEFCRLIRDCWQTNAMERPSFREIVQRLDMLLERHTTWFYTLRQYL